MPKKSLIFITFISTISILYFIKDIIYNIRNLISKISLVIELKRNYYYLNKYSLNKLKKINKHKKLKKPKISIITPIYNRENFLFRFLINIQSLSYKDFEIIMVDDYSIDNSAKIIEQFQKEDQRIILITNKKNKGTFVCRNIGALYSKGKYIFLPDPDDIININILNICYKFAEKYKYDIIKFSIYKKTIKYSFNDIVNKMKSRVIFQPELSNYMFYGNNELFIIDYYIHNKFIKKENFMNALNSLTKFYLNMYITLWEDTIISYILYRTSKSFYDFKKIGYYYIKNSLSITKNMFKISELRIRFIFILLKIIFEFSKNKKYEKDMANLIFTELNKNFNIEQRLSTLSFKSYIFLYLDIINMYLNCDYINKDNKNILKKIKYILKKKIK